MNEIRLDPRGEVDDVVITAPTTFRMERMSKDLWWICCYRGNDRTVFHISYDPVKAMLTCEIGENELGCEVK